MVRLELSLTVPITNSLAFLFTVFGDWWVERKVISRGKLFSSSKKPKINHQLLRRHLDWDGSFIIWNSALRPKQEQLILDKPILLHWTIGIGVSTTFALGKQEYNLNNKKQSARQCFVLVV